MDEFTLSALRELANLMESGDISASWALIIIVAFCSCAYTAKRAAEYVNSKYLHWFSTNRTQMEESLDNITSELNGIRERLEKQDDDISQLKSASVSRIKQKIVDRHERYMREGSIDYRSLECLQQQYQAYTKLGGNSYVHKLMEDLESLPLSDV